MTKKKILLATSALFIFLLSGFIYYQYRSSFNFVDEYDNIIAAFFMTRGKVLFTDIFHNRQLGMVYISYILQQVLHPSNLYFLIAYHRLFVIAASASFGTLFIIRFGYPAVATSALIELTRFFFFGMMFQAESIIIYPILYLSGLIFEKKKLGLLDFVLIGLFSFFVIILRETYIPLAVFLLIWLSVKNWHSKYRLIPIAIVSFFSMLIFLTTPLKDYIHNLLYVNSHAGFESEFNPVKSILYLIHVFFEGGGSYTKILYSIISFGFILSGIFLQYPLLILLLGLSIPRIVPPGTEMFAGYKLFVWFGLITYFTILSLSKKNRIVFGVFICAIFLFALLSPKALIWKKVNQSTEYEIFFSRYYARGEIIRSLSTDGDELYVDGYESLIFWPAKLPSSYKHTFYYPVVRGIPRYVEERSRMFKTNPPTFYYKECIDDPGISLPKDIKPQYQELRDYGIQSCLYIKKSKLQNLNEEQKNRLKFFGFTY